MTYIRKKDSKKRFCNQKGGDNIGRNLVVLKRQEYSKRTCLYKNEDGDRMESRVAKEYSTFTKETMNK